MFGMERTHLSMLSDSDFKRYNNNNIIIFIYFRHIIHACTICPYDI